MDPNSQPNSNPNGQQPPVPAADTPGQPAASPQPVAPPTQQPQPPAPAPPEQQMKKVGDHALSETEAAVFSEIYAITDRMRVLVVNLMCEKHGYPQNEPVAFQFNFKNRTATAFRPSNIEVTDNVPTPPAPGQTR